MRNLLGMTDVEGETAIGTDMSKAAKARCVSRVGAAFGAPAALGSSRLLAGSYGLLVVGPEMLVRVSPCRYVRGAVPFASIENVGSERGSSGGVWEFDCDA